MVNAQDCQDALELYLNLVSMFDTFAIDDEHAHAYAYRARHVRVDSTM